MQLIPNTAIANKDAIDGVERATALDLACPRCSRMVSLSPQWKSNSLSDGVCYGFARCPACSGRSAFFLIARKWLDSPEANSAHYIAPAASTRQPVAGLEGVSDFPEALTRAYRSAVNVFNVREWPAAATACRRVLEGITKTKLPASEHRKKLFEQIESLPQHVDLNKPIVDLAHQLRGGGNLGAHFDLDKTPNEPVTTLMFDLLDYLIEYLYVLPSQVSELESRIQNLPTGGA